MLLRALGMGQSFGARWLNQGGNASGSSLWGCSYAVPSAGGVHSQTPWTEGQDGERKRQALCLCTDHCCACCLASQ